MDEDKAKKALLSLKNTLDQHKIPFFLIQGTCLGAVREGKFIEGDRDIDVGILFENFKDIDYPGFQKRIITKPFKFPRTHKLDGFGTHIDVTTYIKEGTNRFSHSSIHDYAVVQPAYMMENYDLVELYGQVFNVPSPVEEYLANEYGDWVTPRNDSISKSRIYGYLAKKSIRI